MRYYIIAGEASGDMHAANLMQYIKALQPQAEFRAWGGDKMQAQGATIVKHIKQLAFMGFVEVLKNLRTILGNLSFCKKDIEAYYPNAIIFVDYPGFNMRIAKWAKQQGYSTIYYISPQVWAWRQNRAFDIRESIDLLLCILPFEPEFYKRFNVQAHYVGHPLCSIIDDYKKTHPPKVINRKLIALLPGSRLQEVTEKLPVMLSIIKDYPNYQFAIAQSPTLDASVYTQYTTGLNNVSLINNNTYELLNNAYAALVTSGTATLETALFNVPQVVCYKGNKLSYLIGKQLIKVPYISLVNLICNKAVVKELIQNQFNSQQLQLALNTLLHDDMRYNMLQEYKNISQVLGSSNAGEQAAQLITTFTKADA
jgi:lipid-A-disaccharide synthase